MRYGQRNLLSSQFRKRIRESFDPVKESTPQRIRGRSGNHGLKCDRTALAVTPAVTWMT